MVFLILRQMLKCLKYSVDRQMDMISTFLWVDIIWFKTIPLAYTNLNIEIFHKFLQTASLDNTKFLGLPHEMGKLISTLVLILYNNKKVILCVQASVIVYKLQSLCTTLQSLCTTINHCVKASITVYKLQSLCTSFNYCVQASIIVYKLQSLCTSFNHCVQPSIIVYNLQSLCTTFNHCVQPSITVYKL